MTIYISIIILAFVSGLTTLIGVALAYRFKNSVRGIVFGIGFSTGIMLLISFFELVPESVKVAGLPKALAMTVFGILAAAILNSIIPHIHLIKEEKDAAGFPLLKSAYLIALGLILHDFPEGFAMANSYFISPTTGFLVALATAIHNIPEEFAIAMPIVIVKSKKFLFKMAFLSGLAEPAGAILGILAVGLVSSLTPFFISFAAGIMMFISIHELVPLARKYNHMIFFAFGVILSTVVYLGLTLVFK